MKKSEYSKLKIVKDLKLEKFDEKDDYIIFRISTNSGKHIGYTKPSYDEDVILLINQAYEIGKSEGKDSAKSQIRKALGIK